MTTLRDALEALRAADAAGNMEDARRLAGIADRLSRESRPEADFQAVPALAQLGAGFNQELAKLADAPNIIGRALADPIHEATEPAIRWVRRQLGKDETPPPVPVQTNPVADVLRGERMNPQPRNAPERMVRRVGTELGATLPYAVATMGLAPGAAQMGRTAKSFFAPIARTPGRAALGELAAATGAGTGAGVAREAMPGDVTAEIAGQVFGGLTPAALAYTPSAVGTRLMRGVLGRLSPEAQRTASREAASRVMGEALTEESERGLTDAARLRERMPGFNPSLAEATGSPALVASQRGVEGKASGADLDRIVKRREASEQAVAAFEQSAAPGRKAPADFVVDTARRTVDDLRGAVQAERAGVEGQRRGLAEGLPTTDRAAVGASFRDKLTEARTASRRDLDRRAEELGINELDVTVPFGQWRARVLTEFQPKSAFEDTASMPEVLTLLRDMDQPLDAAGRFAPRRISFQDVKALRERVSDDLMDAVSGSAPNRRKARALTLLKQRIDGLMDNFGEQPEIPGNYRAFRKAYFEEYIDRFEKGVAFKVRQKDGRGFYQTPDEKVATTFFEPGNVSAARQYKQVFGDDAQAHAGLEAVVLDSLRDGAVRDGVVEPRLLESWLRRHDSVLAEFPAIRAKVADVAGADTALLARQADLDRRYKLIGDQVLTRELDAYAKATKTADNVIDAALKDPRKMVQLVRVLREKPPQVMEALRRQVWDRAAAGTAADIFAFLRDNHRSLRPIFSQDHIRDLADIATARMMHARVPSPQGAAFVPKPMEEVERIIGQGIPQIGSRIFAFKSGRMQKGYLVLDTFMRGLRGRAAVDADDMFREALYDPEIARSLRDVIVSNRVTPETAKRLRSRWFAIGETPFREDDQ